jgi:hypothetical protein
MVNVIIQINFSKISKAQLAFLKSPYQRDYSLNVIIRVMFSVYPCPKVLTLSSFHCTNKKSFILLDWKFYLNLAGSELPLVSIERMSQILENAPGSITYGVISKFITRLRDVAALERFLLRLRELYMGILYLWIHLANPWICIRKLVFWCSKNWFHR